MTKMEATKNIYGDEPPLAAPSVPLVPLVGVSMSETHALACVSLN